MLGIKWTSENDAMAIELSQVVEKAERDQSVTKRELLGHLSKIYDPLGVVRPVSIDAPRISQDACKEEISWDSPVCEALRKRWKTFVGDVQQYIIIYNNNLFILT